MGVILSDNLFMKAKKSLGQNFLIDNNVIKKIVSEVDALPGDLVIEIGPGRGALTKRLLSLGCKVIAYEIDTDLRFVLDNLTGDVKVIYKDFLTSDISEDIKNVEYNNLYLVGNLPYYITTPIIEHVIESKINFKKFTIMVQKEVADRFLASTGTRDYGYITLVLKYYFNMKKVCDVSKYSFNPVPKVESSVVSFFTKERVEEIDTLEYFKFLKNMFRFKRKNIRNNINGIYDIEKINNTLNKYGLSVSNRSEELSEEILLDIFKNSLK